MNSITSRDEYRSVELGQCVASMTIRADGARLVNNVLPLGRYPDQLTERLEKWAAVAPDRIWLAERGPDGEWVTLSYAQGLSKVRGIAASLAARGLSAERPVVILSGNSIDHALVAVGAMYAGVAYAPIATAYSLVAQDFGKLRHVLNLLTPGLVFAADGGLFRKAIDAAVDSDVELVGSSNLLTHRPMTDLDRLIENTDGSFADRAHAGVGPDTIAKFLFTSGSTGLPKAVINTQRMLCSNIEMGASHFEYLRHEAPVLLEWAPWNHTAAGNHNFNLVLYLGGTLHIDMGRPVPSAIETTIRNLREVSPNWYFNVPKGYAAILPYLQKDPVLCESFFRNLKLCLYSGAGIDRHVWEGIDELARRTVGRRVLFTTSLGSTETAPLAMVANISMAEPGVVGIPARGVELKLVGGPSRWEARLRGPSITPGYWRSPDLTAKAFDEEGFFKLGDALRFVDPNDVNRGFRFDGRFGEDFKLSTGTWVAAGPLRVALVECAAPLLQDAVILGLDREFVGALAFLDPAACALFLGEPIRPLDELARDPRIRQELHTRLRSFAERASGSSTRIERMRLVELQPTVERGELTDKGSISHGGVLANHVALIENLFAMVPDREVLCL